MLGCDRNDGSGIAAEQQASGYPAGICTVSHTKSLLLRIALEGSMVSWMPCDMLNSACVPRGHINTQITSSG